LPLIINVSKDNCEFLYDFFFSSNNNAKNETEEDYKNLLLSSSKYQSRKDMKKEEKDKEKDKEKENIHNQEEAEYPVYYKQVKINDIEMILSFVYSLNSSWGVIN